MQAMDTKVAKFTEMVAAAEAYCGLIDQAEPNNATWFENLFQSLPRLHAAVTALNIAMDGDYPPARIDIDARFELFSKLREWLGERDGYWLEYDTSSAIHPQHMTGSLADDLTDIYFDLKPGLELLPKAREEQVVQFWQASFELHWGQHLVDAERHLYALKVRKRFDS